MSPLSSPVQAVLELFQGPLAEVRFADVDAAVLSNSASAVEAAALAVAEQEAQLAELRQTLADRQDALALLAQRALAYARVYAEHDEALTEQLTRITLPRASKPRKLTAKAGGAEASAAGLESSNSGANAEPSPAGAEPSSAGSEVSSAGAEPSSAGSEVSSAGSEASAIEETEEIPVFAAEETADPNADAPSPDAQPARKGKRRSNSTRDEAQGRPA